MQKKQLSVYTVIITHTNFFVEVIFDSTLIKLTTKKLYVAVLIAIICCKLLQGLTKLNFGYKSK